MRINQFVAHAGICARRAAEQLIRGGKITINGSVCKDLAYRVQPHDIVTYQSKALQPTKKHHILLHKPPKYLTTVHDPQGRPTVMDLINIKSTTRLYPVGRLDYMSTGLLIITNDGILATQLAHPSQGVIKTYEVTLDQPLSTTHIKKIHQGIVLEDGLVPIDSLTMLDKAKVSIDLHIGRNRIIRRLFRHLGYRVQQLTRTQYAFLTLKRLPQGKWRWISPAEVAKLKQATLP